MTWPSRTIVGDTHTAYTPSSSASRTSSADVDLGGLRFEQRVVDERGHFLAAVVARH